THHPVGTRCSGKKTVTPLAMSKTKAGFLFSFVNNSDEAVATHYREGYADPKTKTLDQTGRSGDFVCTFNDPLPCLDNTTEVELQNMSLDDGTFNAVEGTNDGTNCTKVEDIIQILSPNRPV
ncbi:hypothetical protein Ancab_021959, partial [Ancistrocladus abbreviatus]